MKEKSGARPWATADRRFRGNGDERRDSLPCSSDCSRPASSCSRGTSRVLNRHGACCASARNAFRLLYSLASIWKAAASTGFAMRLDRRRRRRTYLLPAIASCFASMGEIIGENCRALGFNVDFAPVLDSGIRGIAKRDGLAGSFSRSTRSLWPMPASFLLGSQRRRCSDAANISPGWARANSTAIMNCR